MAVCVLIQKYKILIVLKQKKIYFINKYPITQCSTSFVPIETTN